MNSIKVKDKMSSPVESVDSLISISEVARIMNEKGIGSLLVVEDKSQKGIITERDVVKAVATGKLDSPISDFATSPLITVDQNAFLGDAAQIMLTKKIRRLIVTGENGKIVGIINIRDLTMAVHEGFLALFDV